MFKKLSITAAITLCLSQYAYAGDLQTLQNEVAQLRLLVSDLTGTVRAQNVKIEELESRLSETSGKYQPSFPAQTRTAPQWTPDIGVIADMVAKFDSPKTDEEGADRLSVREFELVFGSAVDPYSRFDATVSFSDFEEASLEEAYLTHFALPWEITGRFGKFKPKFGKILPIHRDSLDTVDLPRVHATYFGHEGLNKAGADFTKGMDFEWPFPQEITFGVLEGGNGEEGSLFGDARRRPTIYAHTETYLEISDSSGLELGASYMGGSRDSDPSLEMHIFAADATLIHNLSAIQRLKLQSEVLFTHRQETELDPDESTSERLNSDPFGLYALVDFRMNELWAAGYRFDWVEPIDNIISNPNDEDYGHTAYITFYQSEFARWRAQFTHFQLADDTHDNQVLIQGTFSIGEHKHKIN